ncbi:hypothetical protein GDO81_006027 [Engystomops pustulosus]|nr:hypothetical protein GDO81_006027 [Engystomops pustulosus]KAG8588562.1 hypothetical protein GDO81_006027 [Engystomops pustulosus]
MVGGFLFFLVQLILIIDLAHSWSQAWLLRAEDGNTKCWYAALLICTLLLYAASIAAIVVLYIYYTKPDDCVHNKVFISLNLIFCVIVSIVSILPKIQDVHPHSGLLQASVITLYTMFVTWSAMANVPNPYCNPTLLPIVNNGTTTSLSSKVVQWWDAPSIVGLVIFILCTLFIRPGTSDASLSSPWSAVWVKISSSWVGLLLYLWTLVAPLILSNRDFN